MVWGGYFPDRQAWPGLSGAWVLTGVLAGNLILTGSLPAAKVTVVRTLQRWLLNPVVRALFVVGLNPLGLVLLETRGRRTGMPRVVPVGCGGTGDVLWIVAEHGLRRAAYVRNIRRDPRVRVLVRRGIRRVWVEGTAAVLVVDDPMARQRRIVGWNPVRVLNAIMVRLLGADLATVRVDLSTTSPGDHGRQDRVKTRQGIVSARGAAHGG
ncbi:MAG: nitroreductase/quinone reductase family protein [Tetrasphaera sp.]